MSKISLQRQMLQNVLKTKGMQWTKLFYSNRIIKNMQEVKRKVNTEESNSILQQIYNNFLIMGMNSLVIGQPIQEIPESTENSLI